MAITDFLLAIVGRFGAIILAPAKQPDMLWILIPIYINWLFTDYLQERKGTDFGNAITNGAVQLWVGIDWMRQAIKGFVLDSLFITKIGLCAFSFAWGLMIILEGAKAKPITHYIGRVREVSYFSIVATPIFYGVIKLDLLTLVAILFFFPIFYVVFEIIDRYVLPEPPGEDEFSEPDMKMPDLEPAGFGEGTAGAGMPQQQFGAMPPMSGMGGMPKF